MFSQLFYFKIKLFALKKFFITLAALIFISTGVINAQTVHHFDISAISSPQTAGVAFSITITAKDEADNIVTSYAETNELADTTGTITPGITGAFTAGVWTGNVTITAAQLSVTITTTRSGGSESGTSNAFDVVAGPLHHIVVSPDVSTVTAGSAQTYTVQGYDSGDNNLGEVTGDCTFSIDTEAGGSWSANEYTSENAGTWTVTAEHTASGATDTATLTVNPGEAAKLAFGQQPTDTEAGSAITPAVTVRILDANDNLVTDAINEVSIDIGTNPSGGVLSGTKTEAAVSGVASFDDLSIDKAGAGYTLTASSGALTGATSDAFNITAGTLTSFEINTIPSPQAAGTAFSITITAKDGSGNTVTGYTGTNELADTTGTITPTATGAFTAGVWTGDVTITAVQTGVTITTTRSGGTESGTSNAFDVVAGALASFTVDAPATGTAGTAFSVTITAKDSQGNTTTEVTGATDLSVDGGAISPTSIAEAEFTDDGIWTGSVTLTQAGERTITATNAGKTGSDTITINPGGAAKLVFDQQPTDTEAGSAITPAVTVRILDANDNLVTDAVNEVSIDIGTNPDGGILSGTKTKAAASGIATFGDLSIDKAGTGYTLTASSGALTGATSDAFDIAAGTLTSFEINTIPSPQTAGAAFSITITAKDGSGNTVTSYTGTNELADTTGTITPTVTGAFTEGVWTGAVTITTAQSSVTITTTRSGGPESGTSNAFDVVAGALASFTVDTPATGTAGTAFSVTITAKDSHGNTTTEVSGATDLSVDEGTISPTSIAESEFTDDGIWTGSVTLTKAGERTITATNAGKTGSDTITINPGGAAKLAFGQQPTDTEAGSAITPAVTVRILDTNDNLVTDAVNEVSIDIGINPSGGVLSGTKTRAAVSGIASFDDLSIDKEGTGYTLTASSGSLTGATSDTFDIAAGVLASFTVEAPATGTAGTAFSVTITAKDSHGNTTTEVTGATDLSVDEGTISPPSIAEAEFTDDGIWTGSVTLTQAGERTITATNAGKTGSDTITINPGEAAKLAFGQQPIDTEAGSAITPAITVRILDANDNLVISATNVVAIAINSNPGSGTLSGTLAKASVDGVATFDDLSIDKEGTGYTLIATSSSLTSVISAAFNIVVGSADKIRIEDQPDGSGTEINTKDIETGENFTVYAISRDVGDNFVANVSVTWELIEKSGGLADSDLVPSGDGKSAVFTGHAAGSAKIHASHATLGDDTTDTITVTVDGSTNILLQPSDAATSGNNVDLLVEISDNNNSINSFGFDFIYDDILFTFKGIEEGTLTSDWSLTSDPDPIDSGKIYINGIGGTSIFPSSSGSLVKIKLQVNCMDYSEETQSQLQIENYVFDLEKFYPNPATVIFNFTPCAILGDVNASGSVTPGDAQSAFEIFLGIITPDFCQDSTSDANCNEYTTPGDAQDIFEHFLGIITLPECCAEYTASSMLKFSDSIGLIGDEDKDSGRNRDRGRDRDKNRNGVTSHERKLYPLHTMGYPAEIIRIPIIVTNPEGISSFAFEMNYPSQLMEFVEMDRTRLTQDFEYISGIQLSDGLLRVEGESEVPVKNRNIGSLVVFTFRVTEGPEMSMPLLIFDCEGDLFNAEISEGNFHRLDIFSEEPRYINLGRAAHMPDGTVRIPVRVSSAFNVKSFGFKLEYTASKMTFIGVEKGNLTEDFMAVKGNEIEFGKVMIGAYSLSGIQEKRQGTLLELIFSIEEEGGEVKVVKTFDDIDYFIVQRGKIRVE